MDNVLERLTGLHPKVIDLSLDRIDRLLEALGRPERKLPPVIHVAGTNGKGSTVATLRSFFEAAGLRAHVYTSPHLVRFAERIRIAGQLWDDEALIALLEEVEAVNQGQPITFFEITTAAAFLAFSRVPADICILETGLGGRLDATNIVERPALTMLTPIAMDHQQFLGGRIETIAAEKVAIMKHGVACIVAKQDRKVNKVVEARSLQYGVPLMKEGEDFFVRALPGGGLLYKGKTVEWSLPAPNLPGAFQTRNAAMALAAMERLTRLEAPPHFPNFPVPGLARPLAAPHPWPFGRYAARRLGIMARRRPQPPCRRSHRPSLPSLARQAPVWRVRHSDQQGCGWLFQAPRLPLQSPPHHCHSRRGQHPLRRRRSRQSRRKFCV